MTSLALLHCNCIDVWGMGRDGGRRGSGVGTTFLLGIKHGTDVAVKMLRVSYGFGFWKVGRFDPIEKWSAPPYTRKSAYFNTFMIHIYRRVKFSVIFGAG